MRKNKRTVFPPRVFGDKISNSVHSNQNPGAANGEEGAEAEEEEEYEEDEEGEYEEYEDEEGERKNID